MAKLNQKIKALLNRHLINVNRLTHIIEEDQFWQLFNDETMTGVTISGNPSGSYDIEFWSSTSFFISLSIEQAEIINH
jgi:hypothetical protein